MKRIVLKAGDGKRIKNGHKKLEGLSLENEIYFGDILKDIIISENSIKFYTDILNGQKTGFFFDQRDKRRKFSADHPILVSMPETEYLNFAIVLLNKYT